MTHTQHFNVFLSASRCYGGYEDTVTSGDLASWKGLADSFSKRKYTLKENEIIEIHINWAPILDIVEGEWHFHNNKNNEREKIEEYLSRPVTNINCPASVKIEHPIADKLSPRYGLNFIKYFLYESFLMMNLSSPGSMTLHGANINTSEEIFSDNQNQFNDKLQCSEYPFEESIHLFFNYGWPKIQFISFNKVLVWYEKFEFNLNQMARSRIERTLFCLLNVSENFPGSLENVIWLASALESIYDTPNAQSYNYLISRIKRLIEVPINKEKLLRRKLREFYDYRNEFAHGDSKVLHPIGHEGWDKTVDEYREQIHKSCEFVTTIIVATLQQYILDELKEIDYLEQENRIKI